MTAMVYAEKYASNGFCAYIFWHRNHARARFDKNIVSKCALPLLQQECWNSPTFFREKMQRV
jgi:hypothetical protein